VSSNLTAQWNFYFANGYVYVYSVNSPAIYYNEPIVPMALSNVPVINVNGQSWLTFQHLLVNWFDQYGVYVQGSQRSSGLREHGIGFDDSTGDATAGILCE